MVREVAAQAGEGAVQAGEVTPQAGEVTPQVCEVDGWFTYQGNQMHYLRWTSGAPDLKPAAVLLHGFMQSAASWRAIAQDLAQDHDVFALDFVGHGQSAKPHGLAPYAYDEMAASVEHFVRTVVMGVPRPITLIGYSMGGRIALRVLQTAGNLFDAAVFEGCNLGCVTQEDRAAAQERNQGWINRLEQGTLEEFVTFWEQLPLFETQRQAGLDVQLRPGRLANDPKALALCLEGAGKQAMPLAACTLDGLRNRPQNAAGKQCALLYIYGTQDPKSAAVAEQLRGVGAAISSIPGGHNVHLEAPVRYLSEVRNFLSDVDE